MNAGSFASQRRARTARTGAIGAIGSLLLVGVSALLVTVAAVTGAALESGMGQAREGADATPSALAQRDIPAQYLRLYEQAAERYGIDWAILAAVGRVECDHGRDPDPSCGHVGAVNGAGAGGPMQFIASTWVRYGVDGDGDGRADRWDAADAVFAAANYLARSGAPQDYGRALLAYDHAGWYVSEVQAWAARYRGSSLSQTSSVHLSDGEAAAGAGADVRLQAETTTPVRFIAGVRASLSPSDGHVALIPAGAPALVQALVVAGNELQALPYGPGGHPDPRGALEEDCSSTVNFALYRAGIRPIAEIVDDNPLAQDYVHWGSPGPGRWVTIYATRTPTNHVFIVIAGLRLDTSHSGTDDGPNASQDGPRWRLLDRIPTWAHWSVRHPPGL